MFRRSLLAASVLAALLPLAANAASTRTHVSNAGSDANTAFSCDYAHPCRTFAAALTVTTAGGEILAIDSSGYGKVTIDRSVSIIAAPGIFAGIGVGSGNGVTIATAGIDVVLRGLTIAGQGGTYGIYMSNGASLSVEDCVVSNLFQGLHVATAARVRIFDSRFSGAGTGAELRDGVRTVISGSRFTNGSYGVYVAAMGGTTTIVDVERSLVSGSGSAGFFVSSGPGSTAELNIAESTVNDSTSGVLAYNLGGWVYASVSRSLLTNNGSGLRAENAGTTLVASGNTVVRNGTGLAQVGTAVFRTAGNNTVGENGADTFGTISAAPSLLK